MKKHSLVKKAFLYVYNRAILPVVKNVNTSTTDHIPKYQLSEKHISNARLLATREELLGLLPQNGVAAELGVDEGDFSESILSIAKPKKLHLIDYWGSKRYNQGKRKKVEDRFKGFTVNNTVEFNIGLSTEVVDTFNDDYFDWIYIDTSHDYETTIQELELYRNKVKGNGIIAGHDYILGNWNGMVRYGVIEAVYEFCVKYDWEILYLTTELQNIPSFAIRRIKEV